MTSMQHDFQAEGETWRSAFGKAAGIVLGIAGLLILGAYYLVCIAGPRLIVTHDGATVGIEPRFLEYDLGMSRLILEDASEGRLILEAVASGTDPMMNIRLKPGRQDLATLLGPHGRAINGGKPVSLVQGHKYRVTVWGNNGFGYITSSSVLVDID